MAPPQTILVAGAGIGGLAFASAYLAATASQSPQPRVILLERGGDPNTADGEARRNQYNHSLTIRGDIDGDTVVGRLGIAAELKGLVTPSRGFYIAHVAKNGELRPVLSTDDMPRVPQGLRLTRYDLWRTLLKRAVDLGAEIRYDSTVVGVEDDVVDKTNDSTTPTTVTVLLASGERIRGDILIAADGAGSAVRRALLPPEDDAVSFRKVVLFGTTIPYDMMQLPRFTQEHHGLICGRTGASLFLADEGDSKLLVGMACRAEQPVARDGVPGGDDEKVKRAALAATEEFGSLAPVARQAMEVPTGPRIVNCRDRMPTPPIGRVVFIGDASHAVSPFAGAGAYMALVDGLELAAVMRAADAEKTPVAEMLQRFFAATAPRWKQIVEQQRMTIEVAHATSTRSLLLRDSMFWLLPTALAHPKLCAAVAVAGLAAAIYGVWRGARALSERFLA